MFLTLRVAAVSVLAVILAMTSNVSWAETTVGLANAAEDPLIVRGMFPKGQAISNLFGNLLLKTSSGVKIDLNMRSTHLTLEGNDQIIINRVDVTIPTGTKIDPGAVQDVRIKVANIPRPGHYKGTLKLWANSDEANALTVWLAIARKLWRTWTRSGKSFVTQLHHRSLLCKRLTFALCWTIFSCR